MPLHGGPQRLLRRSAALERAASRDPLEAPDEGGLGLLLLAGLFDEVSLDPAPGGNRIVLRKVR